MKHTSLITVIALFAAAPVALNAQAQAGRVARGGFGGGCDSGSTATLGFSYYLLSSGYNIARTQGDVAITSEPLVGTVDDNGPAANLVRKGDRIARVNGFAVTTDEGAAALRSAKPGTSLILTLRRDDKLVPVTIVPATARCAFPTTATFSGQASAAGLSTSAAPAMAGEIALTYSADDGNKIATIVRDGPAGGSYAYTVRNGSNPGWLGIGFDCSECGQRVVQGGRAWYFSEPPVIYNVDTGSPAYNAGIRRGDVLIRVDGKAVTTSEAGARLAQVKPGEKLRLTYRRGTRQADAVVHVAPSPVVLRATPTTDTRVAGQLIRSAEALKKSNTESRLKELVADLDHSRASRETALRAVDNAARSGTQSPAYRSALAKLRSLEEAQTRAQQRVLNELIQEQRDVAQKLQAVELQAKSVTAGEPLPTQSFVVTVDTVSGYVHAATRDQRLRYSGTIGGSDVEVRGPGSVNVQRDGSDLVIYTADAIVRIRDRVKKEP